MSKAAKPAAAQATDAPPAKKSKKMLIIIVAVVVLLIGGAAAFFLLKPTQPTKPGEHAEDAHPEAPPKFVDLGTFTANLIHEEGDRYLQVAISLKLTKPELEEKIKVRKPEILHRVNMLLQNKRPSELATFEGKDQLAKQIREQIEYVLGIRKVAPSLSAAEPSAAQGANVIHGASAVPGEGEHAAASAPAGTHVSKPEIAEVLFTSFIIQ